MRDRGLALIGVGEASGEGRAALALEQALTNPLLESTDISQATGVLASFSGGQDMSLFEVEEAVPLLRTAPAHTAPHRVPRLTLRPTLGPTLSPTVSAVLTRWGCGYITDWSMFCCMTLMGLPYFTNAPALS